MVMRGPRTFLLIASEPLLGAACSDCDDLGTIMNCSTQSRSGPRGRVTVSLSPEYFME